MKAFLTGLGLGVGLALWFAPDRGVVTRRKLRDRVSDWSQSASDQIDKITTAAGRAARKKAQGSERTVGAGDEAREELGQSRQAGTESSAEAATLNSISREELMEVNGIGPVLADKIIAGRPYSTFNDLLERGIISHGPLEELERRLKSRGRRSA